MPIQWHKQPDGTLVLWNTDEAQAAPMEVPPATAQPLGGSTAGAFADTAAQAQESGLSEYGFKLKPTADDRRLVHSAIKSLKKGDLTDEERDKLAMSMLEQRLFSIQDDGGVYGAFKHLPGGKDSNSLIVDLFDQFHDRANHAVESLGADPGQLSTDEIVNLYRSRSDEPTRTKEQWRGNVEGQIEQSKGMTGQFQLGQWHQMGGEE